MLEVKLRCCSGRSNLRNARLFDNKLLLIFLLNVLRITFLPGSEADTDTSSFKSDLPKQPKLTSYPKSRMGGVGDKSRARCF